MQNVIIYDDFYPNPDLIREMALDTEYESDNHQSNYPGINSIGSFFPDDLSEYLSTIINSPVSASSRCACGQFRLTKEFDSYRQYIHVDFNCDWAGVVYLTPNDIVGSNYLTCGTKLWRNKAMNLDYFPMNERAAAELGFHNPNDLKKFMETDGLDESKWDQTINVPNVYNRLVLFRPWFWHSIGGHFGTNKSNCRLVQLFFLNNT